MKKILFSFIVLIFAFAGIASASLNIRDGFVQLKIKPGETFKGALIVENVTEQPLAVSMDFADTMKDGVIVQRACSNWIDIPEKSFVISPLSLKRIEYAVTVPGTSEGGYWTALVYSYGMGNMEGPGGMNFNIGMKIEQGIMVKVIGTLKPSFEAQGFAVTYEGNSLNVHSTLLNIGNTPTRITPIMEILNEKKKLLLSNKMDTVGSYPDQTHRFNYTKDIKLKDGKYFARLTVRYEEAGKFFTVTKKFIVSKSKPKKKK